MLASRFEFDGKWEERKGQQLVNGRGLFGDAFTGIHRIETHGFASVPIKGGKGLWIAPNGNPDEAYILGGEHPDHRPKDLPSGGKAIYDSAGNIIKLVNDEVVMDFASHTATFKAGNWNINISMMNVTGNLHVNGNITCSGTITDSDGNNGA